MKHSRPSPVARQPTGDDVLLAAKEAAAAVRLSIPGFWKAVSTGRMPKPYYPLPRAPRWSWNELRDAVGATRSLPREAVAARRKAKLARLRAAADQPTAA